VEDWRDKLARVSAFKGAVDEVPGRLSELHRKTHQTIRKFTEDLEGRFQFNTGIARVMELVNMTRGILSGDEPTSEELTVVKESLEAIVQLLSVFTPHIAEQLWVNLGHRPSVVESPWPAFDEAATRRQRVEVVVQVDGRLRARLNLPAGLDEKELKRRALEDERTRKLLAGQPPRRIVVIPDRLVNIVTGK